MVYGSVKAGHIRPTRLKTHTPLKFSLPHFIALSVTNRFGPLSSLHHPNLYPVVTLGSTFFTFPGLPSHPKGPLTLEEATLAECLNYMASGNKWTEPVVAGQ